MDEQHARQLLTDERAKVEALLLNAEAGGRSDPPTPMSATG